MILTPQQQKDAIELMAIIPPDRADQIITEVEHRRQQFETAYAAGLASVPPGWTPTAAAIESVRSDVITGRWPI